MNRKIIRLSFILLLIITLFISKTILTYTALLPSDASIVQGRESTSGQTSDSTNTETNKTDVNSQTNPGAVIHQSVYEKYPNAIELENKRTQTSRTHLIETLPDGRRKFVIDSSIGEIHYKDNTNNPEEPWKEIDTKIQPITDSQSGYDFQNVTNNFKSYFKKESTTGSTVRYEDNGGFITFTLEDNELGKLNKVEGYPQDNQFIYPHAYDNIDVKYSIGTRVLLEEYVLHQPQDIRTITQKVHFENARFEEQKDGSINFYSTRTNELIWSFPKPKMYELNEREDENGFPSRFENFGLHYEVVKQENNYLVTKVLDLQGIDWLNDPQRVYPLVIDTTLDLQVGASADDVWIYDDTLVPRIEIANAYPTVGNQSGVPTHNTARFTGISGLGGSTIDVSYYTITTDNTSDSLTKIMAEDASAPGQITTFADFASRVMTTAGVDWDGDTANYTEVNSPSLNSVIQELADSYDPSVIHIFHKNDGTTQPNKWQHYCYDTNATLGEKLHIEYTSDSVAPSISLTALSPDPNNDTTPALTGTATEAIGTVSNVQYQMDGTGGSWTACTADDGTFDEASEAFTCTTTTLADGSHTIYVRATDSNGNTTGSGSESTDTFTIDATAPTISITAYTPDPTTDTTPSVTGTATDATTALTAIQYQMDGTGGSWTACTADDGIIDETSEAFTCTTTTLADGSHTIYVRATDSVSNTTALANYGQDTFTIDTTSPAITSGPSVTADTDSVIVTWTSDEQTSSQVNYGLTNGYGSSTVETNTSPRVTSHSVSLSSLVSCTTYHYRVRSKDTALNEVIGTDGTFTTTGCTGNAAVLTETSTAVTAVSGGSVTLTDDGSSSTVALSIPTSYTSSDTTIQVKQLNSSSVTASVGVPTVSSTNGTSTLVVGGKIYSFEALTDNSTVVSSFDKPITVSLTYTDSDITSIDEPTIALYYYDTSLLIWRKLSDCATNLTTNTTTCTTTHFTTFGLFGAPKGSAETSSSTSSSGCTTTTPLVGKPPWLYGAIPHDGSSILLYFTPADNPVDHYVLQYGTKSGNYQYGIQDMGVNSREQMTYQVKLLSPNTTYYFRVRAGDGCATGSWSNEISTRTKPLVSFNNLDIVSSVLTPVEEKSQSTPKTPVLGAGTTNDNNTNNGTTTNTEQTVSNGYDVTVKVTDIDKKPVIGASVTIHSKVQEGKTDKDGVVLFHNVERGEHRILIAYNNYKGEETVNLTGEVKGFNLNVTVKAESVLLSPLVLGIIGFLVLIIVVLGFSFFRVKRASEEMHRKNPA